jgi:hypothetical protein
MRWVILVLCLLFLYTGALNVRRGDDDKSVRRLPFPRRLLGFFQLLVGLLLGGVVLSLFTTSV